MKKIIYNGNSDMVFTLNLYYMSKLNYSSNIEYDLADWILADAVSNEGNYISTGDFVSIEKTAHHISTREIRLNGFSYYIHNSVVVFDLKNSNYIAKNLLHKVYSYYNPYNPAGLKLTEARTCNIRIGEQVKTLDFGSIEALYFKFNTIGLSGTWLIKDNLMLKFPKSREFLEYIYDNQVALDLIREPVLRFGSNAASVKSISIGMIQGLRMFRGNCNVIISIEDNILDTLYNQKNNILLGISTLVPILKDYFIHPEIIGTKLYGHIYNNKTLVISDNAKSFDIIQDKCHLILEKGDYDYISAVSYNFLQMRKSRRGFEYCLIPFGNRQIYDICNAKLYRGLVLDFVNKKYISDISLSTDYDYEYAYRLSMYYDIVYGMNKKMSASTIVNARRQGNTDEIQDIIVIPCDNERDLITPLISLITKYTQTCMQDGDNTKVREIKKDVMNYSTLYLREEELSEEGKDKNDLLVKWFDLCCKTSNSEQEQILEAYNKLKKDLLEEYEQNSIFLKSYNMNNKVPIPRIDISKKMSKEINRSGGFYPSVSNLRQLEAMHQKLDTPIENVSINLKYCIQSNKQKRAKRPFIYKEMSLDKMYDVKKNTVSINKDVLRKNKERG